jgi:hypothetical protein
VNKPEDSELRRFRHETEELMGITKEETKKVDAP